MIMEIAPGCGEVISHVRRLWPEDYAVLRTRPASEFVRFIAEKTGVSVQPRAPLNFSPWLPALRSMGS